MSSVSSVVERIFLMEYFLYILRTSSDTLYIGQTNNLEKRLKEHQSKSNKSAKYIRYFNSFNLVYSEKYSTRKEAMQREWQLKKWSREKKELLIHGTIVPSQVEGKNKSWLMVIRCIKEIVGPDQPAQHMKYTMHLPERPFYAIKNGT